VLVSRVDSSQTSATLQRAVVQRFPNVSAIDLTLILQTVDTMLGKISFAIRFMALFSVVTGLVVLAGAALTGRYQRRKESALLRTLGASRAQVSKILLIEYLLLGGVAAFSGFVLALVGSWALAYFLFDTIFVPAALPTLTILLLAIGLTALTGLLGNRGICDRPPLEVLRDEA